jgi:hypothetical protein
MNQIFYILRKDVRRHWLEIVVSLLLLLYFAWKSPILWSPEPPFGPPRISRLLFGFVGVALCLCWWFLIVRVIQGESLVGDRQFWLTRPYQRRWLLAAKALFIISFVNLPVLVFDVVILPRAGFPPWNHVPGLLQGQLLLTAFLILPIATISAITESLAQFLLVLFGVVAYIAGLSWVVGQIPSASSASSEIPITVMFAVAGGACLAVLVLQYFRRDTWVSRGVLLGSAGVIAVVLTAAPYGPLLERAYPQVPLGSLNPAGVKIEKNDKASEKKYPVLGETLNLYVPIETYGLVQGSLVVVDAARLTIYAPDGRAWNSGWVDLHYDLWPGASRYNQRFEVSSKFYSSTAGSEVDMRVELAVSEYREGPAQQITVAAGSFRLNNDAICSLGTGEYSSTTSLQCWSALNEPAFAAHLDPVSTTCTLPDRTWPSLQDRRNSGDSSADFGGGAGLFPVRPFDIDFGTATDPSGKNSVSIVCPGTNFSLATPALFSRYRLGTSIKGIHLADYRTYSY